MNPSRMSFRRVSTIRIAIEKTAAPWCIPRERQRLANWLLTVIAIMVSTCVMVVSASAQSYTILYNCPDVCMAQRLAGATAPAQSSDSAEPVRAGS
jgi:hypothetical protein